ESEDDDKSAVNNNAVEDSTDDSNDKETRESEKEDNEEDELEENTEENSEEDEENDDDSEKESDEKEQEYKDQEAAEVDSEGFIIHSEKVEGEMDLACALVGKVNIDEGTIEGLTITKEIDTGDERDPMVIQITSPGPVDVDNLETETLDGGAPDFEEICGL